MIYRRKDDGLVIDFTNGVITCLDPVDSSSWFKGETFKFDSEIPLDMWKPLTFEVYLKELTKEDGTTADLY